MKSKILQHLIALLIIAIIILLHLIITNKIDKWTNKHNKKLSECNNNNLQKNKCSKKAVEVSIKKELNYFDKIILLKIMFIHNNSSNSNIIWIVITKINNSLYNIINNSSKILKTLICNRENNSKFSNKHNNLMFINKFNLKTVKSMKISWIIRRNSHKCNYCSSRIITIHYNFKINNNSHSTLSKIIQLTIKINKINNNFKLHHKNHH